MSALVAVTVPPLTEANKADLTRCAEDILLGRRFKNDTERLEKLFALYTEMTAKWHRARETQVIRRPRRLKIVFFNNLKKSSDKIHQDA